MLSAAIVKSLPRPTNAQWVAFAEHLITVHSWYKHLPLFDGGEFVVFLAPDAGDPYPSEHPRLPEENTATGYRRAFGHLDYIWRSQLHEPFDRDGPPTPDLDDELIDIGRFNLFPFVSNDFYWSVHEDDVCRIRNGAEHPHATAILNAYDAEQSMDQYWNELTESEREMSASIDDTEAALQQGLVPDSILRYLRLEKCACESYSRLQEPEVMKLKHWVTAVRQWLG
jgi:hypothetical protein